MLLFRDNKQEATVEQAIKNIKEFREISQKYLKQSVDEDKSPELIRYFTGQIAAYNHCLDTLNLHYISKN